MSRPTPTSPSKGTPAEAAVVVCAYTEERWDDIVEAISSVQAQTPPAAEIVLVIDHNEPLFAKAQEQFPEGVTIVQNHHKQGLSGARNSGIEASSAEIVVFLDDDAVARPGWLAALLEPYADETVQGVGGYIDPIWLTARPSWWPREFDWVIGCSYVGLPTKRAEVRNVIGASMSVRRQAFTAVGGFSAGLGRVGKHPVGAEETELFIRISQRWPDSKVIYVPESTVGHKVPGARASVNYFRRRCFAEGLSKAIVSKLVGAGDGLSSERSYTLKTLPFGVLRGIRQAKSGGIGRSAAIIGGLGFTTAGYIRGRMAKGPERNLIEVPNSSEAA